MIKGTYTYDTLTPDEYPQWPDIGVYVHHSPPCGISLEIGGFVFMTDPDNVNFIVHIMNDAPTIVGRLDAYEIEGWHNLPLHNSLRVSDIELELYDSTFSALSSDALPATALVLDDWETGDHDIYIGGGHPDYHPLEYHYSIDAHLTSAFLIPEPATIFLLSLGGLFLKRRRS